MNESPLADPEVCVWRNEDASDAWDTGCGESMVINERDDPTEIGMKFCCFCGNKLESERDD